MADIVIRNGTIVDGTGAPAYVGDVAIRDGLILDVGVNLVVKGTRELEVLRLLAAQASLHPGVAHLLEVVESSRAVHAVLEYCAGGSLSFLLSSRPVCSGLKEEQAAGLFAQARRAYGNTSCRPVCS